MIKSLWTAFNSPLLDMYRPLFKEEDLAYYTTLAGRVGIWFISSFLSLCNDVVLFDFFHNRFLRHSWDEYEWWQSVFLIVWWRHTDHTRLFNSKTHVITSYNVVSTTLPSCYKGMNNTSLLSHARRNSWATYRNSGAF